MTKRLYFFLFALTFGFICVSCTFMQKLHLSKKPTEKQISQALKESLDILAENSVAELGKRNAFFENPYLRLNIPSELSIVQNSLNALGFSDPLTAVFTSANKCAEKSTNIALPFLKAEIAKLRYTNSSQILFGSDTSNTVYLKSASYQSILQSIEPIINTSLINMGITKELDDILEKYNQIPYHTIIKFNFAKYVSVKMLDGIFTRMCEKEVGIRVNQLSWTSETMKLVYSYKNSKKK